MITIIQNTLQHLSCQFSNKNSSEKSLKIKKPPRCANTRTEIHIRGYAILWSEILYHLREQLAIGTYFRWLLFLYQKKERKMILWQQQKNYHQGHGDA